MARKIFSSQFTMDRKARCFVCQSKSESADGTKRRKINNHYTNLDSATWTTFCHYFYPPPLIGLLDSSSSLNSPAPENEDFSSTAVFCGVCYQTILNLCNLHSQLEFIQRQISKIVAQVSLVFVQEEENHDNNVNEEQNKCNRQRKNKKKEQQQQSDDDLIYSMRRRIRQRYQPSVCIKRANLDIPSQNCGSSSTFNNDMEVDEQFSPLSIHSNDLDLDSDFDFDFSQPIKQEVEDSVNEPVDNEEYLNVYANIAKNPDLPVEEKDSEKKLKEPKRKRKIKPKSISSSEDEEDGSHGDQNQDSKSDSDYEPDHDSDSKLADKQRVSISKAKIKTKTKSQRQVKVKSKSSDEKKVAIQKKPKNSPRAPYKQNKDLKKPTDDKLRRGQRTRRIDDDTFIYDDIYKVKRVTEPDGIFLKCETCGVLKKSTVHMKAHLREIHIESKKFICEICGFSCPTVWRIKTHMESHEEVGKYVCDECGKIFKTQRELKRHQECHSAQPFVCATCGSQFVYKSSLRKHMKKANHPEAGPAPEILLPFAPKICGVCKKDFVKEETFQKHMATFHGVKTPCDWCGGLFTRPQQHKRLNCKERFKHQDSGQNNANDVFSDVEEDQDKGEKDPFFES